MVEYDRFLLIRSFSFSMFGLLSKFFNRHVMLSENSFGFCWFSSFLSEVCMLFFFSSIVLFKFLENSRFHRLVTLWSRISCCQLGKHSSNVSRLFAHHCFPIYTHTWTNKKKRDHKSLLEINRKKNQPFSTVHPCLSQWESHFSSL